MNTATATCAVVAGRDILNRYAQCVNESTTTIDLLVYAIGQVKTIDHAGKRILWNAIYDAPRRGVICRVVIARHAATSLYEYGNAKAAIDLMRNGWQVRRAPARPLMHSKLGIFDNTKAMLGSHNLTSAALLTNHEISSLIDSPMAVKSCINHFATIWTMSA
jgi:phosphatidylserine/phosphatidylglycerophosphate/cardiolipin synthase-like enzyme